MNDNERLVRRHDVLWRRGPQVVLVRQVDDPDDLILELAGGAGLLWLALDEPATPAELAGAMDVDTSDIEQALTLLRERDLVEPA